MFGSFTQSDKYFNTVQKFTGTVKNFVIGVGIATIVVGVCYIIISPMIGVLSRAFMSYEDVANPLVFLIPHNFTLDNMRFALQYLQYWSTVGRTLIFSGGFALFNVLITSMVGYGFARFRFRGSNVLFALVIVSIVVPPQTYMVPLFINFRFFLGHPDWNWVVPATIGGYAMPFSWSLLLLTFGGVGLRSGLYIYIFRQFFRGLPKEIEEAALIDGAGPFYTYAKIMIPNAVPALLTVFLFAFVWHYNDVFYSSLLVSGNRFMPIMITSLGNTFRLIELNDGQDPLLVQLVVFAGVILAILPVLTIYVFLQRQFVEGLERSGIVG